MYINKFSKWNYQALVKVLNIHGNNSEVTRNEQAAVSLVLLKGVLENQFFENGTNTLPVHQFFFKNGYSDIQKLFSFTFG